MGKYQEFDRLATVEFGDIVVATDDLGHKLRIYLKDKSFVDFYLSTSLETTRFSIHWERRHLKKGFYRLDNTPDPEWKKVPTFPLHFHSKNYENVQSNPFAANSIKDYLREFLGWVKVQFDNRREKE